MFSHRVGHIGYSLSPYIQLTARSPINHLYFSPRSAENRQAPDQIYFEDHELSLWPIFFLVLLKTNHDSKFNIDRDCISIIFPLKNNRREK